MSEKKYEILKNALALFGGIKILLYLKNNSMKFLVGAAKVVAKKKIEKELDEKSKETVERMFSKSQKAYNKLAVFSEIPKKGIKKEKILEIMQSLLLQDKDEQKGKLFGLVYSLGDKQTTKEQSTTNKGELRYHDFLKKAHNLFMHENALSPMAFPSLRKMENEVIAMTSKMLNGNEHVRGSLTTGGTESILMVVKSSRDRAKALWGVKKPNMICCITCHAAFSKSAHYL